MPQACATCALWQTDTPASTWAAPCAIGRIHRPEAWQGCDSHMPREEPTIAQQSAARGETLLHQMWQQATRKQP